MIQPQIRKTFKLRYRQRKGGGGEIYLVRSPRNEEGVVVFVPWSRIKDLEKLKSLPYSGAFIFVPWEDVEKYHKAQRYFGFKPKKRVKARLLEAIDFVEIGDELYLLEESLLKAMRGGE